MFRGVWDDATQDCEVSPVYEVSRLDLYEAAAMLPHWLEPSVAALVKFSGHSTVEVAPIQLHALVLATFASIIAPFGTPLDLPHLAPAAGCPVQGKSSTHVRPKLTGFISLKPLSRFVSVPIQTVP